MVFKYLYFSIFNKSSFIITGLDPSSLNIGSSYNKGDTLYKVSNTLQLEFLSYLFILSIFLKRLALFRGNNAMDKPYLFNPLKINVFKTQSLKIFNLAQQNLTKLLCKNYAKMRKAYISYVAIYAIFLFIININSFIRFIN